MTVKVVAISILSTSIMEQYGVKLLWHSLLQLGEKEQRGAVLSSTSLLDVDALSWQAIRKSVRLWFVQIRLTMRWRCITDQQVPNVSVAGQYIIRFFVYPATNGLGNDQEV